MNTGIFPSQEPATRWRFRRQVFTANGTWNRPANVRDVQVEMCGAGGTGYAAPCVGPFYGGLGGNISALVREVPSRVAITVGSAPGGSSSFGSLITCTGGSNAGVGGGGANGSVTTAGNVISDGASSFSLTGAANFGGNGPIIGGSAPSGLQGVVVVSWMEPVL